MILAGITGIKRKETADERKFLELPAAALPGDRQPEPEPAVSRHKPRCAACAAGTALFTGGADSSKQWTAANTTKRRLEW